MKLAKKNSIIPFLSSVFLFLLLVFYVLIVLPADAPIATWVFLLGLNLIVSYIVYLVLKILTRISHK
jgi:hypothetical protein